jgi:hypothetical protein
LKIRQDHPITTNTGGNSRHSVSVGNGREYPPRNLRLPDCRLRGGRGVTKVLYLVLKRDKIEPIYTHSWENYLGSAFLFKGPMEDTEARTKVLKNGAVYDLDKKKIVSGALLTSDKARELVKRRVELKQERIMAGAAKVLERTGGWDMPNDLDVVEAIGEAVMESALDIDSKKQIEAAKFILAEAGLSASQSQRDHEPTPPGAIIADPDALHRLLELIEADKRQAVDRARAVDAQVTAADE